MTLKDVGRDADPRRPRTPIDPSVWLVNGFALVDSTTGGEQRIVRECG